MNATITEAQIAYIHGRTEAQLEGFARSLGVAVSELTTRVATLLLASQSGQILGIENRVSTLSGKSTKRRQAVRPMAVARGTYRRASHKTRYVNAQRAYWARMTKEERSAEMLRRMKKRLENAA